MQDTSTEWIMHVIHAAHGVLIVLAVYSVDRGAQNEAISIPKSETIDLAKLRSIQLLETTRIQVAPHHPSNTASSQTGNGTTLPCRSR
jgi:hypothetical protein